MTKFCVRYNDEYCIVNTESDAQEMILTFAEARIYEDYLWENDSEPCTPTKYFGHYREEMDRVNSYRVTYPNTIHGVFESIYAFVLDWIANDCGYFPVEVID